MNKRKNRKLKWIIIGIGIVLAIVMGTKYQKVTVCIDAGHGGNDAGAVASNGARQEKDDNLKVALKVKEYLEKQNIKVVLTRKDDTYVSLEKRSKIANYKRADLFVSIHRNSAKNGNGVEIWIGQEKNQISEKLANDILDNLEKIEIQTNRGVKTGTSEDESADYFVNKHTKMPSCLIELGFITNEKDNQLLDENINQYAEAIAKGILENLEKEKK